VTEQKPASSFKSKIVQANWRRAGLLLAFMLWVLAWIGGSIWPMPVGNMQAVIRGFVFGLAAVLVATGAYLLLKRLPLRGLMGVTLISLVPLIVVSAWLGLTLPAFLTSLSLSSEPQPLRLSDLARQRPEQLPAYVEIEGYLLRDLTLAEQYDVRDNSTKRTRTKIFYQTPLVGPDWSSDLPVLVAAQTSGPWYQTAQEPAVPVTRRGILYPVEPRPGERPWYDPIVGVKMDRSWYEAHAPFAFQPDRFYFLSDESPFDLRFMFLLFSIFILLLMAFVVKLAL
jgi:hypothetical protein